MPADLGVMLTAPLATERVLLRVGILDILAAPSRHLASTFYHFVLTKQYASVTPQAIAVWCRRAGYDTFYATYYGVGRPERRLPPDLDVVFICSYTQASPFAYALARLYKRAGTRTIIGGPHAKSFSNDCSRFFDVVVRDCNEGLIRDIVAGQVDPGSIISSATAFDDLPSVEDRMPEIRTASFFHARWRTFMSSVPMLSSVGCPYTCNFCVDWNNPFRLLPLDRLAADLQYISEHLPGVLVGFHDPNFGVKFDQVLEVIERLPPASRPKYVMESSLSILRGDRMNRLKDTNCVAVAPGIESWTDYSNKAGVGKEEGTKKVIRVAEHFRQLSEHVPYLQANFIFGLDSDQGHEPIELTTQFMRLAPVVWPTINIPVPFGGTPLHAEYLRKKRILEAMPFGFYYAPYLVTTLEHYDPITFYELLIDLLTFSSSAEIRRQRWRSAPNRFVARVNWARTMWTRAEIAIYRELLDLLRADREFREFHEGRRSDLPEFYQRRYERDLGRYAELLSRDDRRPDLTQRDAVESAHGTKDAMVPITTMGT
jgi:radical SAM superfamily enzyme YgiQ (UPF0313 family)